MKMHIDYIIFIIGILMITVGITIECFSDGIWGPIVKIIGSCLMLAFFVMILIKQKKNSK